MLFNPSLRQIRVSCQRSRALLTAREKNLFYKRFEKVSAPMRRVPQQSLTTHQNSSADSPRTRTDRWRLSARMCSQNLPRYYSEKDNSDTCLPLNLLPKSTAFSTSWLSSRWYLPDRISSGRSNKLVRLSREKSISLSLRKKWPKMLKWRRSRCRLRSLLYWPNLSSRALAPSVLSRPSLTMCYLRTPPSRRRRHKTTKSKRGSRVPCINKFTSFNIFTRNRAFLRNSAGSMSTSLLSSRLLIGTRCTRC